MPKNWSQMNASGYEDVEFTSVELSLSNQLWCMTSLGFLYSEDLGNAFQVQRTQFSFKRCSKMSGTLVYWHSIRRWFGRVSIKVRTWQPLEEGLPRVKVEDAVAWKGSFVIATEQGGYYLSQSQQDEELATVQKYQ